MNDQSMPTFFNTPPVSVMTNVTPITFECMWEFNAFVGKVKHRTVRFAIYTALWALMLFFWIGFSLYKPSTTATLLLVLCALMTVYSIFMIVFLNVILKNQVKKHPHIGGSYSYTFEENSFVEDFVAPSTQSQTRTAYSAIIKVEESENYLYLFNQPNTAYIVSKQGFTLGSEVSLKMLLRVNLPPEKIKFNS